jgi:hypothetical protein
MKAKHTSQNVIVPKVVYDPALDEVAKNRKPSAKWAKVNEGLMKSNLLEVLEQLKKGK